MFRFAAAAALALFAATSAFADEYDWCQIVATDLGYPADTRIGTSSFNDLYGVSFMETETDGKTLTCQFVADSNPPQLSKVEWLLVRGRTEPVDLERANAALKAAFPAK